MESESRPVKISQDWRIGGFNHEKGHWNFTPIVKSKLTNFDNMKTVKRDVWIDYIRKGWLFVTDQLREWLDDNGFENVIHKDDLQIIRKNYHCSNCKGITFDVDYCDNPECPNSPCCGKPRELCDCEDVNCKCDGCGKMYHEKNVKLIFGEFNMCDDCKDNPNIQFE